MANKINDLRLIHHVILMIMLKFTLYMNYPTELREKMFRHC